MWGLMGTCVWTNGYLYELIGTCVGTNAYMCVDKWVLV